MFKFQLLNSNSVPLLSLKSAKHNKHFFNAYFKQKVSFILSVNLTILSAGFFKPLLTAHTLAIPPKQSSLIQNLTATN